MMLAMDFAGHRSSGFGFLNQLIKPAFVSIQLVFAEAQHLPQRFVRRLWGLKRRLKAIGVFHVAQEPKLKGRVG